jgi:hypothetical protein
MNCELVIFMKSCTSTSHYHIGLDVEDRAHNYSKTFPKYTPLQISNGRIYGMWIIGNWYNKGNSYYGAYPHKLKQRVLSLFPDCHNDNVMHLFSGEIKEGLTFDINPDLKPNICDNVKNIKNYAKAFQNVHLIMADPPYDKSDFQKYNCQPFNKTQVIRDLGTIMKPGSFLTWLDTRVPMYSKKTWNLLGYIAIIVSTNHRIRCLSLYQKKI